MFKPLSASPVYERKRENEMNELINSLNPALQKLSDTFCVSVDTIREHGMEYILMYGKYHVTTHCIKAMIVTIIAALCCEALTFLFTAWIISEEACDEEKALKISIIVHAIVFILVVLAVFLAMIIPYWVSPEMYSINAVMQLIK